MSSRRPDEVFTHAEGCAIVKADPSFVPEWQEVERGLWRATCQCGSKDLYVPDADRRVRLDPLDPKSSRHLPQCEFASETDPAVLQVLLKVKPGLDEG
jgi:hypothetical protein